MKFFLTMIVFVFSAQGLADCGQKILEARDLNKLPLGKIECIQTSVLFKEGLVALCNKSGKDYGTEYKKYLDFEREYNSKIKERNAALSENARRIINSQLIYILNDWKVFGYKYDIEPYIFSISLEISKCVRDN